MVPKKVRVTNRPRLAEERSQKKTTQPALEIYRTFRPFLLSDLSSALDPNSS
jgi:hypothetical protein